MSESTREGKHIISLIYKDPKTGLYAYAVECGTFQCYENSLKLLRKKGIEIAFENCESFAELFEEGVDGERRCMENEACLQVYTFLINKTIKHSRKKPSANVIELQLKKTEPVTHPSVNYAQALQ